MATTSNAALQAEIDKIARMAVRAEPIDLRYDVNNDGRITSQDAFLVSSGRATLPTVEQNAASQNTSPQSGYRLSSIQNQRRWTQQRNSSLLAQVGLTASDPIQNLSKQLAGVVDLANSSGGAWSTESGRSSGPGYGPEGFLKKMAENFYNQTGLTDLNKLGYGKITTPETAPVVRQSIYGYEIDYSNGSYYPIVTGYQWVTPTADFQTDQNGFLVAGGYRALSPQEITTIKDVGNGRYTADVVVGREGYYNKDTGTPVKFDGTLGEYNAGPDYTRTKLSFTPEGKPRVTTQGESSNDLGEILPILSIALMAIPGIGQAVGAALLPTGVSTTVATAVGNAVVNAGLQVAAGAPVEQALTNAAASLGVSQLVPNLSGNSFVDNAVRSVATATLTGGDVGNALANSLIATGGNELLGNTSFTGDKVVDSAIASAITSGVQAAATDGDVGASIIRGGIAGASGQLAKEENVAESARSGAGFIGEDVTAPINVADVIGNDTVTSGSGIDSVNAGVAQDNVLDLVQQDIDRSSSNNVQDVSNAEQEVQPVTPVEPGIDPRILAQGVTGGQFGEGGLLQTGMDTVSGLAGQDTISGGQAGEDKIFGVYSLTPNQTASAPRLVYDKETNQPYAEAISITDVDSDGNVVGFTVLRDLQTGEITYNTLSEGDNQIVIRSSKNAPTTDYVTDQFGNIVRDSQGNPILTAEGAAVEAGEQEEAKTDTVTAGQPQLSQIDSAQGPVGESVVVVAVDPVNNEALVIDASGNTSVVPATDSATGNPVNTGEAVTLTPDNSLTTGQATVAGGTVTDVVSGTPVDIGVVKDAGLPTDTSGVRDTGGEVVSQPVNQTPVVSPTTPSVTPPTIDLSVTEPVVSQPVVAEPVTQEPITPEIITNVPSTTPQITQPVDQALTVITPTPPPSVIEPTPPTSGVTGIVLQNNGDGTALVLTNDGNAANVPATDAVSNEPLTPGSSVTIDQNTNTATVTPPASDGGAQAPIVSAPPAVQDTGDQQVLGGGQQPTTDAGSIIDTPIGPDTSIPTVPEPVVQEPVVQEPPPPPPPPPAVPTTPEELITEPPQEPVVDKTEEDLLLEQIIRELEPTPPVSEGVPIQEPEFPEPPLVLPESPTINVADRLTIRPVVDRGYRRPPVSPGSRVEESAQILPIRPGLSEGGTGGIEGTTEQEQEPVWNVRSLKLRRLLGI